MTSDSPDSTPTPTPTPALTRYTAFDGGRRIASGTLAEVAAQMRAAGLARGARTALIFDDATGRVVDFDLGGTDEEVEARARQRGAAPRGGAASGTRPRGPGRPRLGVVSREVTLLPRHWAWLAAQRGGASATLRRLVDQARRDGEAEDRVRAAQDATYRFLSAIAGDREGYEEAIRALFRSERTAFEERTAPWPDDLRQYTLRLAAPAFADPETGAGG